MNLLSVPWIPVRSDGGAGEFRLLTYRELLCSAGSWRVSLPRDDMELACLQLLVSMTQIMFLPEEDVELLDRLDDPLTDAEFDGGIAPCADWFDLDHPTQPFMQTRGVKAKEDTPIQKLLIGLPDGNNHCFFNEVGEVSALSAPVVAIALFNQAVNCPSFGGGFKGSLRGGAPITTLVDGPDLRQQIWRNVLTYDRVQAVLPDWNHDLSQDHPTWVDSIAEKAKIGWNEIGLARGLFWQPAHVELTPSAEAASCDLLGIEAGPVYKGFRKEKFNFQLEGTWPHPYGSLNISIKKGAPEYKFSSFTTSAPAWTRLTELVIRKPPGAQEGSRPAGPVTQAKVLRIRPLHLLVGGYRNKQASILERRHELISLAEGWDDDEGRLDDLVRLGLAAKKALRGKLYFAVQGKKDKGLAGIAVPIHETAEKLFFAQTEAMILDAFSDRLTFEQWNARRTVYVDGLAEQCRRIFEELTEPYAMKPELIPIIAWARRSLNSDLRKLKESL